MKKILLLCSLLLQLYFSKAQVIINLQLPQAGLNIKSQLWNMALVNTGTAPINVKLEMILSDLSNGQTILSGSSREFNLVPGTMQVQVNNLNPIQYNVLNSTYNIDASPDGFLPIGAYNICFSVFKRNSETYDKISEECQTIEVEPVSPPFLNTPVDESEIEESRPLFTWIPPSPVFLFNDLNYELKLVEVLNNQTTSDAVEQNIPIMVQDNISSPSLQFPFSLEALDTGKVYAWQIKAMNNASPISNSEVFSFRLKTNKENIPVETNVYVKLKGLDELPLTVCKGTLKYEYVNTYNNKVIKLELNDVTTKINQQISLDSTAVSVKYGQNFLRLDLSGYVGLKENHVYLLRVRGIKGEPLGVKFIFKKED